MELWERSAALDLLDDLLRRSATGGRVAVVPGEAGLGKSALVTEFARRCGSRAWVLWGGCDPLVTPRALGPLHDIGRQAGGALAAQLSLGAGQEEIFAAFLHALSVPRRHVRPVIVVEDVHWADGATLDWLAFVGRRMDRLSGLLIVTYRNDEVGPEHPLRRVLASLPSAIVHRVPLEALSHACVLEQARLAGRDGELVYRLGGGNPLLVTELMKADESAVPGAVQDLILDRIQALPAPARDLAHLVAVVPTRADASLVSDVPELVDLCIGAGVLVAAGDGVSFRHELLRSAVEDSLTPPRRAGLHQRVLRVLVAEVGIDPGRLVHHARFAGDTDAVLRYGRVAGVAAARQGAHREALGHFRAVAAYADRLDEPERAELLERYANEAHLTGHNDEALRVLETALALRERLGQPELVGENLRLISQLAWWTGRADQAVEATSRAVELLETSPDSLEVAVAAYSAQAQNAFRVHDLTNAIAWAQRARELAEQRGDSDMVVHIRITELTARLATGDLEAWSALEEIHRKAVADHLVDLAARALGSLASVVADELAEYDQATPLVEQALAFTAQHDLDGFHVAMLSIRSKLRLERCDWEGALADADATLASSGLSGVNSVLPLVVRGRIRAARGSSEALVTLDQAASAAAGVGDVPMIAPVAEARSEYFLLSGDAERSREEARRGLDFVGIEGGLPFIVGRLAWRLFRAGGHDEVPAVVAEPFRWMIDGEWAKAAEEWGRRGATYLRAEALAAGDVAAAGEALRVLDGLGATRAAQHLRAELRRRGVARVPRGPRRTTAANSAGLTPREADVLSLLVEGLSNAEIADRLTLSPKTVGHHISGLLGKLGVSTRGQAVAEARRRDLIR